LKQQDIVYALPETGCWRICLPSWWRRCVTWTQERWSTLVNWNRQLVHMGQEANTQLITQWVTLSFAETKVW